MKRLPFQKRNDNIVDRIIGQYEVFAFDGERGTADKDRIHALDSLSRIAGINRDSLNLTNSEQEPESTQLLAGNNKGEC